MGWLDGAHPEEHEGKGTRQVCFSWNSNCCHFSSTFKCKTAVGTISITSMGHILRIHAISVSAAPTDKELDTTSQVLEGT